MPTTLEQLQYGFDRDSRRIWRQRATTQGWDNAYVYDSLSQVSGDDRGDLNLAYNAIAGIPASGSRWQYDETGNWHGYQTQVAGAAALTQARTHDKGNRLMEVSDAAAMRTDRGGRMLETVPGPGGDWSKSYQVTWDAWSRITQVKNNGEVAGEYTYDGLHRRVTRVVSGETLHSYYNDEWRPVEERKDSESTAAASYLWGSRHRDDLVRRDRAVGGTTLNESRYILMDYFSPAAITDANGSVKERYQFSAFGLRTILNPDFTVRSNSECLMEFAFQGQFEDAETGWLNYGYRYYLPALGRWACKDPVGEEGGFNLYEASDNQTINFVDLLGLATAYDSSLKDAAQRAAKLTQASTKNTPAGIPFFREYCGLVCCNKDGDHKVTEPHPGKWNGPAKNSGRNWVSSTLSEDKSTVLEIGTPGTCDPDKISYTGKEVTCENTFGAGWVRVGAYHSHPPGDTEFSKADKAWSRSPKGCRLGLGTCDERGKPVTKEFIPDMKQSPTQANPFPGNERTL